MFKNYLILNENNEEILYLFLENNLEASKELTNLDQNEDLSFKQKLLIYLNNNNINYLGKKIFLVIGGIIIGFIILESTINLSDIYTQNFNYKKIDDLKNYELSNYSSENGVTEKILNNSDKKK